MVPTICLESPLSTFRAVVHELRYCSPPNALVEKRKTQELFDEFKAGLGKTQCTDKLGGKMKEIEEKRRKTNGKFSRTPSTPNPFKNSPA